MNSYIRLFALASLVAASIGFGSYLPTSAPAQEKPIVTPGEQVVIGPFQVDELYNSGDRKEDRLESIANNGGPWVDDMLTSMKGWKFYILDRKVKEKDRWVWDRPEIRAESEYPKMLLDGWPTTSLKDKKGKAFPFNLNWWKYNYTLFQGSKNELARMDVMFRILIGDSFIFSTGDIRYDVTGKYEFLRPKK
jgi:hypothetical protein